jgi:hypothetical protein
MELSRSPRRFLRISRVAVLRIWRKVLRPNLISDRHDGSVLDDVA